MPASFVLRPILAVALACSIAGCLSLAQAAPEKQRFAWTASRPSSARARPDGPILLVRPATTAPGFGQRAFVVKLGENRFEHDFYHEHFVPPAEAISDAARAWLARGDTFAAVVATGSGVPATHRLELEVRTLHADLCVPAEPAAVLEIAWFLVADAGARLLAQGTAGARERAQDASGAALALAFDRALARALAQLEEGLRASIPGNGAPR